MERVQTDLSEPVTRATPRRAVASSRSPLSELHEALIRYFDVMYECDHVRLDDVFAASAQLHGYRGGDMVVWSIPEYREVLSERRSPMSLGATRTDEVLLIDFVSDEMAITKVRLRINEWVFVDYLTWHRFEAKWLITAKGFHLAG